MRAADGIENYKQKSDKAGWRIVFDEAVTSGHFPFSVWTTTINTGI
jgi:hypothetical protein